MKTPAIHKLKKVPPFIREYYNRNYSHETFIDYVYWYKSKGEKVYGIVIKNIHTNEVDSLPQGTIKDLCNHPSYERVIDQDKHEYCGKCYKIFD